MSDYSDWTQRMIRDAAAQAAVEPEQPQDPEAIGESDDEDLATGPLSQMMIANAPLVQAAIDAYGAESVAVFFIDLGTGIAASQGIGDITKDLTSPPKE